jgi:hypothetical protein
VVPAAEATPAHQDAELELIEENEMDIPIEELREFLSADLFEVPADPAFKEGLREKLWELIRSGRFGYGKHRGS